MAFERRPFEDYDFRPHHEAHFAGTGKGWAQTEPAYRYGYDLANEYDDDWDVIEQDARTRWYELYPGEDWDSYVIAVRYSYGRARADRDFQEHYDRTYAGTGKGWAEMEPAYGRGYELAYDDRYRDVAFDDLEMELQKGWAEGYPDRDWDEDRDAIRYAWERGTLDYAGTGKGWAEGYEQD